MILETKSDDQNGPEHLNNLDFDFPRLDLDSDYGSCREVALQEGGEEGGGQLLGMDIGDTLYSWDGHLVDFYLLQIHICVNALVQYAL